MTSCCDYGHCVHNTFVSLTEGRSARDLPKQQPAKKKSLACGCSPGPLWLKAKGIKEVFDSQRSHIRTFVHPNPITFPGIYAPEGLFCCPGGPKNVARKVTAIHCMSKDISDLAGLLVLLPRDGESIPTLVSTPINLNVHEEPCQPSACVCAGPQP